MGLLMGLVGAETGRNTREHGDSGCNSDQLHRKEHFRMTSRDFQHAQIHALGTNSKDTPTVAKVMSIFIQHELSSGI
eukprot:s264_g14.t1